MAAWRRGCLFLVLLNVMLLLLLFLILIQDVRGFVNSPKIISKDGNLIFESGSNRNISFRLQGKSRLTINDEFDIMELLMIGMGGNISVIKKPLNGGKEEWSTTEDKIDIRDMADELETVKAQVFGENGLNTQMRRLSNETRTFRMMVRRYQTRLRTAEGKVQRLTNQLELNSCQSNPCENGGSCYNIFNGFRCQCSPGFEGTKCEGDVNECALYDGTDLGCQNGAQCVNQVGTYSCICAAGWYGIHCLQRKGDCAQGSTWELCGHGSCVASSDVFGYRCICEPGWRSNGLTPACTADVDECSAESHTPCSTKCINLPGSFTCAPCAAGLTGNGVNCRDINECEMSNGGCSISPWVDCINTYGSHHCGECPVGWTGDGKHCERTSNTVISTGSGSGDGNTGGFTSCAQRASICHPSAICSEISGTVVCSCPVGMLGNGIGPTGCLFGTANNCNSLPCMNGGTCVDDGLSNFTCICPVGFRAPRCQPLDDPCRSNPCHNGGRCHATGRGTGSDAFTCLCMPGYRDRLCTTRFSSCNGVLAGERGRLRYPPEGTGYEHNAQCAWVIRTNTSLVLNVTFNSFDVEDSTECRFDWLQINDGRTAAAQVIGRYCGNHRPHGGNIISSTNYLYLWFRSDNSTARAGFDLEWTSIIPQCGGLVDFDTHGTIASPGSPGNYPPNRDCQWRLHAPINKRIKLTFFSLQIEQHSTCNFDFVKIIDEISGLELYKYCTSGTSPPPPLLLPTHQAIVRFHSDNTGSDIGFQLHYSTEERLPGCGGLYSARQGTISTPTSPADEPISCEYEIQAAIDESIVIEFESYDLKAQECIELYDISKDGSSLLQSKYCGDYSIIEGILPPSIHSLYNRVRVKFYGGHGGRFKLKYRMDCSLTFESPTGVVMSPGYPNQTTANHRLCTYKIITAPTTVISLHVSDFDLHASENVNDVGGDEEEDFCTTSNMMINDGLNRNVLGPYCGQTVPERDILTKSNMLIITWKTESGANGRGFRISYASIPMGSTDCGGVYTKPGGIIRLTVDASGQYLNSQTCYWVIMAPPQKAIQLNWRSMDLEQSSECSYDYVEVYDNLATEDENMALARFCSLPYINLVSHERLLTIKFVSDSVDTGGGFELSYNFIDQNTCGGHLYGSRGKILSPEFPLNYTNGADCEWRISGPQNSQLELVVELFELEASVDCSADWLTIRNGGSNASHVIGRFCGTRIPRSIPSYTHELSIQFHSDMFVSARGFRLSWRIFARGCGGKITSDEGIITSPNYPNNYPANAHCVWHLAVHPGSTITFVIEDLSFEEMTSCRFDYLQIFDGTTDTSATPNFHFCKEDIGITVRTNHSTAMVVFETDSSVVDRGFRLSYKSNCWHTIRDVQGVIESTNFGEQFEEHAVNCSWTIQAPKGNLIQIELSDLERMPGLSRSDRLSGLYLSDGNRTVPITELGKYKVTGDFATIRHNSSDVKFRLEFNIEGCLKVLRGETGSFESPQYPGTYPKNIECRWIIQTQPGNGIELTVNNVDIENSVNCTKDALVISSHPVEYTPRERHCGQISKLVMTSASHQMHVSFISDSEHNGLGFSATYRIVPTICGGKMTGKSGTIISPNYPMPYPINMNCEWVIEVSPHHKITFEVEDVELEAAHSCTWDYLEAFDTAKDNDNDNNDDSDGRQLFKICTTPEINTKYQTTSNNALVRLVSDDSISHRGFKLHFYESCGEKVLIDDVDFEYIQITHQLPRNETCEWQLIASDPSKHIIFTPTHLLLNPEAAASHLTEGDCLDHGVKVYEGTKTNSTPLLRFCMSHPPAVISTGNALTVTVPMQLIAEFEGNYMTMDTSCGSTYDAIKGKFTSPYYPRSYPVNIECVWLIQATPGNSIDLTFESMDMEESDGCNNDYVELREESEQGPLLGVFCGHEVPPTIKGKTSIWIKFKSNDDVVGEGFMASYNHEIQNELSGTEGTVMSPRYPSVFISKEPYTWRITVDKDYVVVLHINHIFDDSQKYVRFYDGYSNIGVQLDYTDRQLVITNTNILFFSASRGPFYFTWERLSKEAIRSNRTAEEQSRMCGRQLISVNNTISFNSPGFPLGYAANLNCSWSFVPSNPAMHVVLQLGMVDLETFGECMADYMKLSASANMESWQQLAKICTKPTDIGATTFHGQPYLKLDFITDATLNKTGFSSVVQTECGSELTQPRGLINITALVTRSTMFKQECVWTIRARLGHRIRITFLESQFGNFPDVCRSFFVLRNGFAADSPFLGRGKYCDNNITDILETSSNRAYIKFKRLGSLTFRAAFYHEEISHPCSDQITLTEDSSGNKRTISSPNFPNLPHPHSECVWRITAPPHHSINIEFLGNFDLTGSPTDKEDCDHEYVQLNDGNTELMPMLGRYCGNRKPDSIQSSGNVLRLKYFTDVTEPRPGFQALVSLSTCGGAYYSNEGIIASPEPGKLRNGITECVYTIEVEKGNTIGLNFTHMQLTYAKDCANHTHLQIDEIEIGGDAGDHISDKMLICGPGGGEYTVDTNKLVMRLRLLDGPLDASQGFRMSYRAVGTRCSKTIVASRGVLQSAGYPDGVRIPTHCVWRVQVPKGKVVKLNVLDFDPDGTNGTSMQSLRSRISFYNDFKMLSLINRYTENPPGFTLSTDNTMTIDTFLFPYNRHRGIKLLFTASGQSLCPNDLQLSDSDNNRSVSFSRSNGSLVYCQFDLKVPPNRTLLVEVARHVSRAVLMSNAHICAVVSPLKITLSGVNLLPSLLCEDRNVSHISESPPTIRLPFSVQAQVSGNRRNDMQQLNLDYKLFPCGGIIPLDLDDNMTIVQPTMGNDFGTGRLDCAWAIWPPEFGEENMDELETWIDGVQIEISLSVNLVGNCSDNYLLLYSGPDQNSPHLGRYCGQMAMPNVVVERGLFFEYHTEHYENRSAFNLTVRHGSGCGGKLTYPYRQIIFSEQYKNNVECVWEIEAGIGFHIGLSFPGRFFIESSVNCTKDYLRVQQRNEEAGVWDDLSNLCGRQPPSSVNTTTSAMRLIFRSDGDTLGDGFSLMFERNCGGFLYAKSEEQVLFSPGYPNQYDRLLFCNYTIAPISGAPGVLIRFLDFDLEHAPGTMCVFDNVTIQTRASANDVEETVLCGVKQKHQYRAKKSISVVLRTDISFAGKGFKLLYSTQLCGGVVTGSSVVESPRQHTDNNFPPQSNCFWNLTTTVGNKFIIKFEELDFEGDSTCSYDGVEVFEGSIYSADHRLGKFCGKMSGKLPVLSIPNNEAIIRSYSDHRDPSRGFRAIVKIMPNCDQRIYVGGEGGSNASYTFDKYSSGYENNLDCSFIFTTTPGRQLRIEFRTFHLELTEFCRNDFVEIRDGAGPFSEEIGRFCGHEMPPTLVSSQRALFVRFVTDYSVNDRGFEAVITSAPLLCGQPSITLNTTTPYELRSPIATDGDHYPANVICSWRISAEKVVHLKFNSFDLEGPDTKGDCTMDFLKVYTVEDAKLVENGYGSEVIFNGRMGGQMTSSYATEHVYCGTGKPDDYYANSKDVMIKFRSNDAVSGRGFSIKAMQAEGCFRNFTGLQGRIRIMDTSDHCDVHIRSPSNYSLSLYFGDLTFASFDCEVEYVEVFDDNTGAKLQKYCSYIEPGKSLFSSTNALRLRIKMGGYYSLFDITYLASNNGPGCGGELYNTEGLITNAFYPENVRNNTDCRWNIRVPSNTRVLLIFKNFDMGSKSTCHTDYLQIIESSGVMRQFCGEDKPQFYRSDRSEVTVRFHKTMNYDGVGWVIKFIGIYSDSEIPKYLI